MRKFFFIFLVSVHLFTSSPMPFVSAQSIDATDLPAYKPARLSPSSPRFVEGEVLIKLKTPKGIKVLGKDDKEKKIANLSKSYGLTKKKDFSSIGIVHFKGADSTENLIRKLQDDPNVEYAEPNYVRHIDRTPNDSFYDNSTYDYLWGLRNEGKALGSYYPGDNSFAPGTADADIDAPEAWDLETSDQADVIVAVIDSGVAHTHPDLTNNMWDGSSSCKNSSGVDIPGGCPNHGWDFVNGDNEPADDNGHGTHASGIIAAETNNSTGLSGTSYYNNLKIMALKAGDSDGNLTDSAIIEAINFARYNGASVINASFGGEGYSASTHTAIENFTKNLLPQLVTTAPIMTLSPSIHVLTHSPISYVSQLQTKMMHSPASQTTEQRA